MKKLTKSETLRRKSVKLEKKGFYCASERERFCESIERIYSLCNQIKADIKDYKDEDITFETM